jgi:hypothetical protein
VLEVGLKMSEKKEEKIISAGTLDWKKGDDYRDKFSEVMVVIRGDRSIILDFGVLEEEGKKGEDGRIESINPYIEHHTRIRVSPEHFEAVIDVLTEQFKLMKEKQKKGK